MSNVKISELTEATTPTTDDLVVIVDDPGGTPASKKATLANLLGVALTAVRALTVAANKIPYFTSSSAAGLLSLDTDGTLAGNSDTAVASQKAVKTYADTKIAKTTNITSLNETGIADGEIAVFNLTNKDIRTSNVLISTDGTPAGNADTNVPTEKATKTYADTKIAKALYDAYSILAATSDDTPAALTVGEQSIVGRITGGAIAALTAAQVLAGFVNETENVVEDLSWLPPVMFTWDPAELVDAAGETSSGQTVPGATLGATSIQIVAPYDLQDCTVTGYVQANNTVEARIQNESGGTINFASGTWLIQARRV